MQTTRRDFLWYATAGLASLFLHSCAPVFLQKNGCNLQSAERKIGLIVNPDWSYSHSTNVFEAYGAMRAMQFRDEDIFVLSYPIDFFDDEKRKGLFIRAKASQKGAVEQTTQPRILGPATRRNLETVLEAIADQITDDDLFFMYVTGLGRFEEGKSRVSLSSSDGMNWDKYSDDDLAARIRRMQSGHNLFVFDQCHSRGFADKLSSPNSSIITRTDVNEEDFCREFMLPFFAAFGDMQLAQYADRDNKGYLTLEDVFVFARNNMPPLNIQINDIQVDETGRRLQGNPFEKRAHPKLISGVDLNKIILRYRTKSTPFHDMKYYLMKRREDENFERQAIYESAQVVYEKNEKEMMERILTQEKAVVYFKMPGCNGCEYLEDHIIDLFQQTNLPVYVIDIFPKDKKEEYQNKWQKAFNVDSMPTIIKLNRGKVQARIEIEQRAVEYGVLPDRTVQVIDKDKYRRILEINGV